MELLARTDQCGEEREGGEPQSDVHTSPEGCEKPVQIGCSRAQEANAGKRGELNLTVIFPLNDKWTHVLIPFHHQVVREPPKEAVNVDNAAELFSQL